MGFACLADEVRYRGLQRRGVASDSSCTSIEQSIKQGINIIAMHQTHDQYCNGDVLGHKVGTIPFKRSQMQSHLQMCFKFEFEIKPYGCSALFTHFKMVKHENRAHIHSPWIFLIILDILFVIFGVKMN